MVPKLTAASALLLSAEKSLPAASLSTRLLPFTASKLVHGCVTMQGMHHESTEGLEVSRGGQIQCRN
jgi:hypothetical protein